MGISDEEIEHLGDLSRLELDDDERNSLEDDLDEILDLAQKIQEVDTEDVEPTYHALPVTDVTRPDDARESQDPEKVLDHAPDASDGYFVVPGVIDE